MDGDAGDVLPQHALVVNLRRVVLALVAFWHQEKPGAVIDVLKLFSIGNLDVKISP